MKVNGVVHLRAPDGKRVKLTKGDDVPGWAEGLIQSRLIDGGDTLDTEPEKPEADTEPEAGTADADASSLDDLKVGELRELAEAKGVDLTGAKVKDDIVKALTAAGVTG